jgi:hypothetical protein
MRYIVEATINSKRLEFSVEVNSESEIATESKKVIRNFGWEEHELIINNYKFIEIKKD